MKDSTAPDAQADNSDKDSAQEDLGYISPTLLGHCCNFYELLEKQATVEKLGERDLFIFRGSLTQAYKKVGISQSYYSKIMRILHDCGSIQTVSRGARNVPSVVALLGNPEINARYLTGKVPGDRITQKEFAAIVQRVANLEAMLGGINIKEAFVEIEKRLTSGGK